MCGQRHHRFINRVLYSYNDLNPLNDMVLRPEAQSVAAREIRSKPPYAELEGDTC